MADAFDLEKEILEITDPKALRVIVYLLERVRLLEEKVAALSKDSSTSSKPPSSDIVKPLHEQRQPGKRKAGGQPRHPGVRRRMFKPEEIDRVEDVETFECPECGGRLEEARAEDVYIQQMVELKEKPVEVVEYRQYGHLCEKCGKIHYQPLPAEVIEGQLCGPRLQALLGYLKGNLGASYTELSQLCSDVFGTPLSRGMICRTIARVSEALAVPYKELEQSLPEEKALNIDESGWKDSGHRYWVWVFCTQMIAYFTINRSRGCKVLEEVLGKTFKGGIVSDFFSAYVSYATPLQQYCLAHLIRDIKFLTTLPDPEAKEFGERLLEYFRRLFHYWHARDQMGPELFRKKMDRLKRRLFTFLCSTEVPKGASATMKKRLVKHWASLFRFIEHPELLQPTNNRSEQTLRHAIRVRRQTQGTRCEWGRQWSSRILTVIGTCRKQDRSAWQFIYQSVMAHNFGTKMPSLIPQAI
jgi:transposase